jgi:hypothetical protein
MESNLQMESILQLEQCQVSFLPLSIYLFVYLAYKQTKLKLVV